MTHRGLALVWLVSGAAIASEQAPPAGQDAAQGVFPARIEQVTVDVVVLDKRGEPVVGLAKDDFTILDEGRRREVTGFEVVRPPAPGRAAGAPAPGRRGKVAHNLARAAERGRLFVVVFDDLHMSPGNAQRAKAAVAAFLAEGTREGDRILLLATSGEAWWSARLPAGRDDLLAVLKHLDGRRVPDSAMERITDHEAVQIFVHRNALVAARVQARFERYGTTSRQAMERMQQEQMRSLVPGTIDAYVDNRAAEAYLKLKARLDITLGIIERCFRALEGSRDRKQILLVSEGFAHDPSNDTLKRVVDAARQANAALYFVDTRGLQALSQAFSAEFGAPLPEQDLMSAIADVSLEGEGAAALAEDTGGFAVRNSNDFAAGAVRIGRESQSYYLLGFDPGEIPRDGRFHRIEVRVRGKNLAVRARRGYYAPLDGPPPAHPRQPGDPQMQRALDAPGVLEEIPLRLTAYVAQDASVPGRASVVLAAEADVSRVDFVDRDGKALATLDTLTVVAHRESSEFLRDDQKVELERRGAPRGEGAWYTFVRSFELRPGTHQAKLVVRDAASKRAGSAILEFEVPPLGKLRVSTPVLTDTLQRGLDGSLAPAFLARREFASASRLYCRFDVFGAAKGPDGMPRVRAGHALRRSDGTLIGRTEPHLIQPTSIGALLRLIQIPLDGLAPGDYELVLTVTDDVGGESRELVEPFSVTARTATAR